jgi:hypothetical protein
MDTSDEAPRPHVFVTGADLTRLACDAWVVPTDRQLIVSDGWQTAAGRPGLPPEGFRTGSPRAYVDEPLAGDGRLRVWTNLGADFGEPLQWFVDGAREAVARAARYLAAHPPAGPEQVFPRVGVPLVGAGGGGGRFATGEIVRRLLPALETVAQEGGVDVYLAIRDRRTYAAVQAARTQLPDAPFTRQLDASLLTEGDRLAALAREGQLVLFIGAGASLGSGVPDWPTLLDLLAADGGFSDEERVLLHAENALDRARLIGMRLKHEGRPLGPLVASLVKATHRSLTQTLLASLPVLQVATTNYDQLFEVASQDIGVPCAILPYAPGSPGGRWLLKLHGCVTHPEDIVLTRDDYLRFSSRRAALAGIVQALLVTRHMLFVGFSLQDDNFHRIVHDVRSAMPATTGQEGLGTALFLHDRKLLAELWKQDLIITSVARPSVPNVVAARRVAMLLDYIGMQSAGGSAHLLDPTLEGVLSAPERELAGALRKLVGALSDEAWDTPAGRRLAGLLREFGLQEARRD